MMACIAMGVIVGLIAGASLLTLLLSIYRRLATRTSYPNRELISLLGLVSFLGGGTWSRSAFIPSEDLHQYGGLYLMVVAVLMVILSAYPLYLLSRLGGALATRGVQ